MFRSSRQVLSASLAHAEAIAEIYNQGICSREATFETVPRTADQVRDWFTGNSVIKVALEQDDVIGFAAIFEYRPRECYRGVGEFSVYMHNSHQNKGVGRALMLALFDAAANAGYWKLVSRVFPENVACRRLLQRLQFREVGIYEKHARLSGAWRDVVIVEKLLCDTASR